jgi:hypothetical protein
MYYIIKLAPLTILQSLITILEDTETRFKAVSYAELYKVPGYRTQDTEIIQAQDSAKVEGAELCRKAGHDVFQPRPEFDLRAIFSKFDLEKVYVDLYYSKVYSMLLDTRNVYPTMLAKNSLTISLDTGINSAMGDDKAIALELKDGNFQYVPVVKTTVLSTLCMKKLYFPYREFDLIDLAQFRDNLASMLYNKRLELSDKTEKIQSMESFIPKLPEGITLSEANVIDKNKKLNEKIQAIKTDLEKILNELGKMHEIQSYFRITLPFQIQIEKINDVIRELLNLFDSPKSIFEYVYQPGLPKFDKDSNIPISIYQYTENRYVVRVGYADLTTNEYVVHDWYDFLQISQKDRIQIIDLLLFIISSVGVLIASFSGLCQCTNGFGRKKEQNLALQELVKKRKARSEKARKNLISKFREPKQPPKMIPLRPMIRPRAHAIQVEAEAHYPPLLNVPEPTVHSIRPSAPPMKPSTSNTVQDVKEILQLLNPKQEKKEQKTPLPIFCPLSETGTIKKQNTAAKKKTNLPLWMEGSESD